MSKKEMKFKRQTLRALHGLEAVGLFQSLVDLMEDSASGTLSRAEARAVALGMPQERFETFLDALVGLDYVMTNDGKLFVPEIAEYRAYERERKRQQRGKSSQSVPTCPEMSHGVPECPALSQGVPRDNAGQTGTKRDKAPPKPKKEALPFVEVRPGVFAVPGSIARFEANFDEAQREFWLDAMENHAKSNTKYFASGRDLNLTAKTWERSEISKGRVWCPALGVYAQPNAVAPRSGSPPVIQSPLGGGFLNSHEKNLIYKAERKARLAALDAADAQAARTIEVSHDTNGNRGITRANVPDVRTAGNGRGGQRLLPRAEELPFSRNRESGFSVHVGPGEEEGSDSSGTEFDDWELA